MARRRATPAIRDVIAERVLEVPGGKEVGVRVGRPRKGAGKWKGEWVCEFQVLGAGNSKVYTLPGVDSLQALQMALAMMAVELESNQHKYGLTFLGDSQLMLMRPDFEAMISEIKARPDFKELGHVLGGVWEG